MRRGLEILLYALAATAITAAIFWAAHALLGLPGIGIVLMFVLFTTIFASL